MATFMGQLDVAAAYYFKVEHMSWEKTSSNLTLDDISSVADYYFWHLQATILPKE